LAGGEMSPGWSIVVADLNGDGRSDLFLYHPSVGTWFAAIRTAAATLAIISAVGTD
jgi:hypothetical protein